MPLIPTYYRYAAVVVAVALLALGIEQWGEHRVRVEWDKDKAVRAALLKAEQIRNEKTVKELEAKHEQDIKLATNKAGRAAINRWLREHRVLPDSPPVLDCGSQATSDSPGVPNGTGGEQEPGGQLAEFATGCATDAMRLSDWQELCRVQGCEVSR